MKFTLEIELGNDAMRYGIDLAEALREQARIIDEAYIHTMVHPYGRPVRDRNGNVVGKWEVVQDNAPPPDPIPALQARIAALEEAVRAAMSPLTSQTEVDARGQAILASATPAPHIDQRLTYRILPAADDVQATEIDADQANDLHRAWCVWELAEQRSQAEAAAWEEVLAEAARLIGGDGPGDVTDVERFEK